jgi:hypothetical protein
MMSCIEGYEDARAKAGESEQNINKQLECP